MSADKVTGVDPELLPLLESFPDIPLNADTLEGFRAAMVEMAVLPDPADHPNVAITEIMLPGPQGAPQVRCLLYRPLNVDPTGAMLHIHGGGYVMGTPEMDGARNSGLVEKTGCIILSPDYRKAPDHAHPAGLEDCYAALLWLTSQADELGFAANRLGLIGESAGGGMAAALALLVRNRGGPALAFQTLIYPMIASQKQQVPATASDKRIGQQIWTRETDEFGWQSMATDGDVLGVMPPASASDLSGLPPAFIGVGELDLFVHDNLAYASRLLEAGVSVEAHLYPAAFHGFDRMENARVSQKFAMDLIGFLQRMLA